MHRSCRVRDGRLRCGDLRDRGATHCQCPCRDQHMTKNLQHGRSIFPHCGVLSVGPKPAASRCRRRSPHRSARLCVISLTVCAPQYVPVHVLAHLASLFTTDVLIEAEMDSAVDTRVIDVVGDLLEVLVLQDYTRDHRVAQRDEMVTRPVESLEYF